MVYTVDFQCYTANLVPFHLTISLVTVDGFQWTYQKSVHSRFVLPGEIQKGTSTLTIKIQGKEIVKHTTGSVPHKP